MNRCKKWHQKNKYPRWERAFEATQQKVVTTIGQKMQYFRCFSDQHNYNIIMMDHSRHLKSFDNLMHQLRRKKTSGRAINQQDKVKARGNRFISLKSVLLLLQECWHRKYILKGKIQFGAINSLATKNYTLWLLSFQCHQIYTGRPPEMFNYKACGPSNIFNKQYQRSVDVLILFLSTNIL